MTKLILAGAALVAGLAAATTAAQAHRPTESPPAGASCKTYIHGGTGRAWSESKARQRARGKWETSALFHAGYRFRKWDWSEHRHYDCSKHGKWHHCIAAAYPCEKVKESVQ